MSKPKTPAEKSANVNAVTIAENTVLLSLDFSRFGNSRTVDSQTLVDSEETDPRLVKVQKVLFDSVEYGHIKTADAFIKRYVETRALPSLFKSGTFLLPIALVEDVDARLIQLKAWRKELVTKFVAALPTLVELAKKRLGPLFNATDYPSQEGMLASFGFRWSYLSLQTPKSLQGASAEIFAREKEKMEKQWTEAHEELTNLLRAQMLDLVAKMNDSLAPGEEGKKKTFKGASIGKIAEFLEIFDARNVTNDAQLKGLVNQARALLEGVDAKLVNDNERVKAKLARSFADMQTKLSDMVTDAPSRKIATGGDDV